jgi:hypothetical protein
MFSIALGVFILTYFVLLVIIGIFFLINLLHLVHTGTITFWSLIATLITAAFLIFVIATTMNYIATLDWQAPITLGGGVSFTSPL